MSLIIQLTFYLTVDRYAPFNVVWYRYFMSFIIIIIIIIIILKEKMGCCSKLDGKIWHSIFNWLHQPSFDYCS